MLGFHLPHEECLNYFLQGLNTSIRNSVILQRSATFEEAESHAKLHESLPQEKPDRTDKISADLAKLQLSSQSVQKDSVAAYNGQQSRFERNPPSRDSQPIDILRSLFPSKYARKCAGPISRNMITILIGEAAVLMAE